MKPKIFITVQKIIDQGGISTSILNLLNEIHEIYDVTLCSIEDYISPNVAIPSGVKIIRGSALIGDAILNQQLLTHQNPFRKLKRVFTRFVRRRKGMVYIVNKGLQQIQVPKIEYDAAIAFSGDLYNEGHLMEGSEYEFVSNYVKAKHKVAWVHNDIRKQGYTHEIALNSFRGFDAIVAVSYDNKALVDEMVPEYKQKVLVVYNTYNLKKILEKSRVNVTPYENNGKLHFVTVARLSLDQKRQDRIIEVCGRLKKDGFANFDWYLVGGGDIETLKKMANEHDVMDIIHFEGLQTNPYPYMLNADAFVLTSLYEGYGMTIKEAQILDCPTLVTNFGPAHEAVEDGKQGLICDNSTEGVYNMIKAVLQKPETLNEYRLYLKEHPVNNDLALNQFREACGLN